MAKVVTMGEIMLRLSTPNNEKFIQADEFDINYGGGEANVAVSLANYGHDAEFVTAVPNNEIGECAVAALRKYNVKTDNIAKCGERLGIYYLETGASMRPSKVVYDRAHSSISTATAADFDFDKIFEGADWFHFTGITPAVSDAAAELTEEALKAAKAHGVKVSVDLNFRKKLWSSEKAQKVMKNLMKYVDVCIGNEEDAELVLVAYGISSRVCRETVEIARAEGLKLGLIRPITLWPFPVKAFKEAKAAKAFLTVEMNILGQMMDDVKLAVGSNYLVDHYGSIFEIPETDGIIAKAKEMLKKEGK